MPGWKSDYVYECNNMYEFTEIQKYYIKTYDTYWNHFDVDDIYTPKAHKDKYPIYLIILGDCEEFGWTKHSPSETSVIFDKIIPSKHFLREQKLKRINK